MSKFRTEKIIPLTVPDLTSVANELQEHFRQRGYEVQGNPAETGGWEVSITKGGIFKSALGVKTALNITVTPHPGGTKVEAGAGVFGRQAVPTAITLFIAWPVVFTQIWGLIRQSQLDDEAVMVVQVALQRRVRLRAPEDSGEEWQTAAPASRTPTAPQDDAPASVFCTGCGQPLADNARFCSRCGTARPAAV